MNPYKADLWDLELFCRGKFQLQKDWQKLKKDGTEYLKKVLEFCPAKHEWEFNQWCFGAGNKYRVGNQSQEILVAAIYISFINERYRDGQGKRLTTE